MLASPYQTEIQADGRGRHYGYIDEVGKWLRAVVEDDMLLNRFFDRGKLKRWGTP